MLVYKFYSEGTSLLTGGGGEATRQFLVCIEIGPFVLVCFSGEHVKPPGTSHRPNRHSKHFGNSIPSKQCIYL